MKKGISIIVCLMQTLLAFGQKQSTLHIEIVPMFGGSKLVLDDSTYALGSDQFVRFSDLRFYVSAVQLLQNDSVVYREPTSFHLVDANAKNSMNVYLEVPSSLSFNKLVFQLGIDSITNVSGVMGGELDPTKGMYWTWQSGYINLKIEGTNSLCKTPKNEFQLHLGGYQSPFSAMQTVAIKLKQQQALALVFDVKHFLQQVDFVKQHHIMSPSREAVILSEKAAASFSIQVK